MKHLTYLLSRGMLICMLLSIPFSSLYAQCNPNEKYDKIISGYHSSIALKDDGVYAVWGSAMKSDGSTDQLAPQNISVANYSTLTGTVLKAALGGKNAGAQVDQAFVLTTDGLWAWGIAGNVVSSGVKSGAGFGRTSTTSANGFNTYGLPTGVTPANVANLFATYQTLVLLTTSGNVYMLTQTTLAVEGNAGTASTAGTSQWKQVRKSATAGDFLTNVTAVRGQVSSTTLNAFMALTSTGQVYTWGNSAFLGDGNTASAKNVATLMTLPAEFSSSIPKMIGVTGGITSTATTKNTYYILSNAGNLYALGDNTQKQCGDFVAGEKTSWVRVKKSAATNDYLTNVSFFSCQEHNNSYPAVAAITGTTIYTWGNNSSGMIGRTDNGTTLGTLNTVSFDPGIPVDFTGTATSVELGGHTMVYLKEGSTKFCYVGHYTNGSMGDNTSNNNGSPAASVLKHDCSSTPAISICGTVAVAGSPVQSAISVSIPSIVANGASTSTITVQLKTAAGVNLTASGGNVLINSTIGTVGAVSDNNNGSYTAILTSSMTPGNSVISFTLNGTAGTNTSQVSFTATTLPLTWLSFSATRQQTTVKIKWSTTSEVNVKGFDIERSSNTSNWTVITSGIPALSGSSNNYYAATDSSYHAEKMFYRIKQVDVDGHFTYSTIQMIPAITEKQNFTVYPVPASTYFELGNTGIAKIKLVELINMNGATIKSWQEPQSRYAIADLAAGIYMVRVMTSDNSIQTLKLKK